ARDGQRDRKLRVEEHVDTLAPHGQRQRDLIPEQARRHGHDDVSYACRLRDEIRWRRPLEEKYELMTRPEREHGSQELGRVHDDATGVLPDVPKHDPYAQALDPDT
ncbi:MAG: hypothetical protein MUF37_07325, partial [Methanoregulaceae archaeon]|nr:hypothetical protein [Methanoregulaceae archaeon]